jgi:hypothetical protein
MHITLPAGRSEIEANLKNTLPRTAGNIISLVSWTTLCVFILYKERKNA